MLTNVRPMAESDPTGIALHNGIWGAIVSGGAMTAMTWWWDDWVKPANLYRVFVGPSNFTVAVPWLDYHWKPIDAAVSPTCTDITPGGSVHHVTYNLAPPFFKIAPKSGSKMCFAIRSQHLVGAGGPNQNTPRIQYKDVQSPFGL